MNDYAKYQFLLSLFNSAFSIAVGVFAWWRTRNKAVDHRFEELKKRVEAVEKDAAKKLGAVEEKVAGKLEDVKNALVALDKKVDSRHECASHSRMEETDKHIMARLESFGKLLGKIDGRLEGINRMVDLLTQNELNGGKG